MARKLKTYQTSLGFFDLAVAAPSMKAALEAWGADSNLFHQGAARQSEDPHIVAATMAAPGVVLKRPVGSSGPSKSMPSCLPISPAATLRRRRTASRRAASTRGIRSKLTTRRPTARRHALSRKSRSAASANARRNGRRNASGGSTPSTRHKAPWTLLVGSTKRTLPTSKPRSKFSRKCRRPKTPIGRRKGNDWKLRCDGREGRAERVQRKHYLFERCFACKAVTAEE